jgi:hypothetical protein
LIVYGSINATAVAGGAWFGPIGWPRSTAIMLNRARRTRLPV